MIITLQNGLNFELNSANFTAKVISSPKSKGNVYIPKYIEFESQKYPITNIGQRSFKNNFNITTVIFSKDSELLTIDKESFYNSSLESICIPSKVYQIGESSFYHCTKLIHFEIPNDSSLKIICKLAFSYSAIESISIPSKVEKIQNGWCRHADKLKKILISPSNKHFCYFVQKVIIEKTKTYYDYLIFARHDIKSIIIPSFIKKIGSDSFSFCKDLENVYFTDDSQLVSIECNAFYCSSLRNIVIPMHVFEIGGNAFYSCEKLKKVEFSTNCELRFLGRETFSFSSIECIKIPNKIREIGKKCFFGCSKLKKVLFEENSQLKTIEKDAFYNSSLEYIEIPRNVEKIEEYAFSDCKFLTRIEFLSDELKIDCFSFNKCKSLILASFPNLRELSISINAFRLIPENLSLFVRSSAMIHQEATQCLFQFEFDSQSD